MIHSFRKGQKYKYKTSSSLIEITKGGSDRINGMLKVKYPNSDEPLKEHEMSVDFLSRQLDFGFVEKVIAEKAENPSKSRHKI